MEKAKKRLYTVLKSCERDSVRWDVYLLDEWRVRRVWRSDELALLELV